MKRLTSIALVVAAGFITAGSAMAQDNKVMATVPFSFSVNGRSLPAGHYTIESDLNTPHLLMIEDRDKAVHVVTLVVLDSSESRSSNKMVFHKYGNQYFLSDIRSNGAPINCHLTTSKQEKWAKAQIQDAALRVDQDVLIALK